jgi:DNA repair protein RecN (Recombination protein N)
MIENLKIKNFSIIKDIDVKFDKGLNVIYGESGSGKSLILYALNSLLGDTCSSSIIREGENKCIITSDINNKSLQRIITENKSLSSIDGENTLLKNIKVFRDQNIQFHFQGSQQSLYQAGFVLQFIDSFIKDNDIINEVKLNYNEYLKNKESYENLINYNNESESKIEFYKFQLKEIEEINIKENEDIELENSISNYNNIHKQLSTQENCKDEIQRIIMSCNNLSKQLDDKYVYEFENFLSFINELQIQNDNKINELNHISEMSIDQLNQRLYDIQKIKKKLSKKTIQEINSYREFILDEIKKFENKEDLLNDYKNKYELSEKEYLISCNKLSDTRKKISGSVHLWLYTVLLNQLKFDYVEINIDINKLDKYTDKGIDDIQICISFNKGFSPLPIKDILSGGEASRLSLAFKLLNNDSKILILDEIETGLSGNTLLELSNTLKEISSKCQVICVSHSKEIIDYADNKIKVFKAEIQDKAETKIEQGS